jgi:hypothetical protein
MRILIIKSRSICRALFDFGQNLENRVQSHSQWFGKSGSLASPTLVYFCNKKQGRAQRHSRFTIKQMSDVDYTDAVASWFTRYRHLCYPAYTGTSMVQGSTSLCCPVPQQLKTIIDLSTSPEALSKAAALPLSHRPSKDKFDYTPC